MNDRVQRPAQLHGGGGGGGGRRWATCGRGASEGERHGVWPAKHAGQAAEPPQQDRRRAWLRALVQK
eukprot:4336026-Prymnesium_polylepis.1